MLVSDVKWDLEADVVIIGYGSGGASVALTAADLGANVLILEKQRIRTDAKLLGEHCSTSAMAGGVYLQPTNREDCVKYFRAMSRVESGFTTTPGEGYTGDELIDVYTDESMLNKSWLEGLGFNLELVSEGAEHSFPGIDNFKTYRFEDSGWGMMLQFEKLVAAHPNIKVMYETAATRLITDLRGDVTGVQATTDQANPRTINIRGGRSVVMAMGGFEFNEDMKLNYLRVYPSHFTGSEACTGDGVTMAAEVGAQFWHMNCVSARLVMKFPEYQSAISIWGVGTKPTGYILTNKYGQRYTNERTKGHTVYYETTLFDSQKLDFPRVPSFWIFDQQRMNSAKLAGAGAGITGHRGLYSWSSGNKEELARGWIKTGDTLPELAANLGMHGDYLKQQVEIWNGYAAAGKDPDFNRRAEDVLPLNDPPYFGVPLYPGGPNTQGGAKHDTRGQVLSAGGEPIGGLYAVGEFGSMFGMLYPSGGGNLSECFAMGRIVGRNAVKYRE